MTSAAGLTNTGTLDIGVSGSVRAKSLVNSGTVSLSGHGGTVSAPLVCREP